MGSVQQRFKILALHCATAATTPSPPRLSTSKKSSSTCFAFRRGVTLKRLLSRRFFAGRSPAVDRSSELSLKEGLLTGHKLKDLFVCSPPHLGPDDACEKSPIRKSDGGSLPGRLEEYPFHRRRFGSFGLRQRLLKGAARRPRLGAIPE